MEASFYDEENMPTTSTSQGSTYDKGKLKLDFSSTNTRRQTSLDGAVLTSPDLHLLTLGSPELEKLIMSYGVMTTPTPSQLFKGTASVTGSASVTEQQEMYARGFMEALQRLHDQQDPSCQMTNLPVAQNVLTSSVQGPINLPFATATGINNTRSTIASTTPVLATGTATISTQSLPLVSLQTTGANQIFPDFQRAAGIQNEPSASYSQLLNVKIPPQQPRLTNVKIENESQIVPGTPPLPPIDLALQETVKNERKKQRNRVAASKCRKRKLEKEADLEQKVTQLKGINTKLHAEISELKKQVSDLKIRVMDHVQGGCEIMLNQPQGLAVN